MRGRKRLPYSWLMNLRLIPPLFKEGDRVRVIWDGAVRVCFPEHRYTRWVRPSIDKIYTANKVDFFQGRTKNLSGYKVELAEKKAWWFWAYGFIRADFTGWVALASALRLVNRKFFRAGQDYCTLWRVPCGLCQAPMRWHLSKTDSEPRCGVCRYLPSQAEVINAAAPAAIEGLVEFLRDLNKILPGKYVRPISRFVFPQLADGKDFWAPPLDMAQTYKVADFLRNDPSKVLLVGADGAYSVNFLEIV